jgi:hypothetical protein
VTTYAFNPIEGQLLAIWTQGIGNHAQTVTRIEDTVRADDAAVLCEELSQLSLALWDTYVRPASAADNEQERYQRDFERESFTSVLAALRSPNLPSDTSMLLVSYGSVIERAHRVGRILHKIDTTQMTDAITAEVEAELMAVEQAELGDLTGRAKQATALDRADASPVQVDAANTLFEAEPLGHPQLFTAVDPAAACVAAAHWLASAATVAADLADIDPSQVFAEADNITACSIKVPQVVVNAIDATDHRPRDVVRHLLLEAAKVREGRIPDLAALVEQVAKAGERIENLPEAQREEAYEALLPDRITLLDPQRPGRDLLEHLLDGLRSCFTLFEEYVGHDEHTGAPTLNSTPLPHPHAGTWRNHDSDDEDPDYINAVTEAINLAFLQRVRDQADLMRDRLD